ncbi:hypothetical protein L504_3649 [Bordetella bronchiseptica F2]|nr:hypothetical protein L530_3416 [Bordetella bronchiseptica MO211]KCV36324.1 hypothetical protein L489_3885 [Bordetella bronchiseptica 00-P-2730]KCV51102.1 hypothetical protein L491_3584 [Bordetella bronchiseptica 3E44]KCV58198.1 hypothetical protein L492_3525 [Bordetella bronchiseptica 7E71]KDB85229.1 hypothetical protein L495_3589 [Bordetella bronchiseptica CARE970018BB]KDB90092.1 hypothetical protein AZ17_2298 [Bordetella bronchiseptica D989]KDC26330.1 hypothetical protein L504_3649 [Bord
MIDDLFAGTVYGNKQRWNLTFFKTGQSESECTCLKHDVLPAVKRRLSFQAGTDVLIPEHNANSGWLSMRIYECRVTQFQRIEHHTILRRTGVGFLQGLFE